MPLAHDAVAPDSPSMAAWLLRAVQQPDGGWHCRYGPTVFDRHDELPEVLEHGVTSLPRWRLRWRPPSRSFTGWTAAFRTSALPEVYPRRRFAREVHRPVASAATG